MQEHLRLVKDLLETERDSFLTRARREKWKRDFLILGEMGLAYDLAAQAARDEENQTAPPILLLDESDKFGASVEDAMLMPLERGLVYVPRLQGGFVGITDWKARPIVVTTSNDLRHKLSAPVRFAPHLLALQHAVARQRIGDFACPLPAGFDGATGVRH